MNKHRITRQQMNNLMAAQAAWKGIPDESVNLWKWRSERGAKETPHCGSPACFGGWLPYIEHFKALGVVSADPNGSPSMSDIELFGWDLFSVFGAGARPMNEYGKNADIDNGESRPHILFNDRANTDHEAVTLRLRHAINFSEVV